MITVSPRIIIQFLFISAIFSLPCLLVAQTNDLPLDANSHQQGLVVSFAPRVGTFQEGSTFNVRIFLSTLDEGISNIFLHINFDPDKLAVVQSVGNKSIITAWTELPNYSNKTGDLKLRGTITPGIVTENGLVGTITFKALTSGDTEITITSDSKLLLDDALSTVAKPAFDTGSYNIVPRAQEGIRVFSPTHPFQEQWYNNNTPVFSWEKLSNTDAFSFILDNQPFSIPDNNPESIDTSVMFSNTREGLSYFHIKTKRHDLWGGTSHFLVRIDTTPPTELNLRLDTQIASVIASRALVKFTAKDTLSGVDHYEIGVIDKNDSLDISPVFVEVKSPYQLPTTVSGNVLVIVKAFDKAGNVSEDTIDITIFSSIIDFIRHNYLVMMLGAILLVIMMAIMGHYLFGHHILRHFRRAVEFMKKEEQTENIESERQDLTQGPP